jgi:hypothetical protein
MTQENKDLLQSLLCAFVIIALGTWVWILMSEIISYFF